MDDVKPNKPSPLANEVAARLAGRRKFLRGLGFAMGAAGLSLGLSKNSAASGMCSGSYTCDQDHSCGTGLFKCENGFTQTCTQPYP